MKNNGENAVTVKTLSSFSADYVYSLNTDTLFSRQQYLGTRPVGQPA